MLEFLKLCINFIIDRCVDLYNSLVVIPKGAIRYYLDRRTRFFETLYDQLLLIYDAATSHLWITLIIVCILLRMIKIARDPDEHPTKRTLCIVCVIGFIAGLFVPPTSW